MWTQQRCGRGRGGGIGRGSGSDRCRGQGQNSYSLIRSYGNGIFSPEAKVYNKVLYQLFPKDKKTAIQ